MNNAAVRSLLTQIGVEVPANINRADLLDFLDTATEARGLTYGVDNVTGEWIICTTDAAQTIVARCA
jgi:hypothetical protein